MSKRKSTVILDTSGLVSLVSLSDHNHTRALSVAQLLADTSAMTILPGEVVTEFMNIFGKKAGHKQALEKGEMLFASEEYHLAETTVDVRKQALSVYKKQPESVSFTDCLVMAFADKYETREIFGFDEVFKKNGYTRLGYEKTS